MVKTPGYGGALSDDSWLSVSGSEALGTSEER